MKVAELIAELQKFDADAEVIMGRDREGNGHSPCDGAHHSWYRAHNTWSGEIYSNSEMQDGDVKACVLFPVN